VTFSKLGEGSFFSSFGETFSLGYVASGRWNSEVGTATGYGLDNRLKWVSSYSMGTLGILPRGQAGA